jgi:hypothetical protein
VVSPFCRDKSDSALAERDPSVTKVKGDDGSTAKQPSDDGKLAELIAKSFKATDRGCGDSSTWANTVVNTAHVEASGGGEANEPLSKVAVRRAMRSALQQLQKTR